VACNRRLEPAYKQHTAVDDVFGVVLDLEVTAHTDDLDARLLGPRERYAVKPFTPATLVGAVRRLIPARVLGLAFR
jgi:hypothetical protein